MYWVYPALSGKLLANMPRIWIFHHSLTNKVWGITYPACAAHNLVTGNKCCHSRTDPDNFTWNICTCKVKNTQTHKHSSDLPCSSTTKKALKALMVLLSTKLKATTCVILFTDLIDWLLIFHKRVCRGRRHNHLRKCDSHQCYWQPEPVYYLQFANPKVSDFLQYIVLQTSYS